MAAPVGAPLKLGGKKGLGGRRMLLVLALAVVAYIVLRGRSSPPPAAADTTDTTSTDSGAGMTLSDPSVLAGSLEGIGTALSDLSASLASLSTAEQSAWEAAAQAGQNTNDADSGKTTTAGAATPLPRNYFSDPLPGTTDARMLFGVPVYRDAGGWYTIQNTGRMDPTTGQSAYKRNFLSAGQTYYFGATPYRLTPDGDLVPYTEPAPSASSYVPKATTSPSVPAPTNPSPAPAPPHYPLPAAPKQPVSPQPAPTPAAPTPDETALAAARLAAGRLQRTLLE